MVYVLGCLQQLIKAGITEAEQTMMPHISDRNQVFVWCKLFDGHPEAFSSREQQGFTPPDVHDASFQTAF